MALLRLLGYYHVFCKMRNCRFDMVCDMSEGWAEDTEVAFQGAAREGFAKGVLCRQMIVGGTNYCTPQLHLFQHSLANSHHVVCVIYLLPHSQLVIKHMESSNKVEYKLSLGPFCYSIG